MSIVQK